MWPSNTRLCWRECWFIFYHSEDIGEASFFGNTSVDFWVLQHFWHAPLATGIWSCIGIPKISINLASRCFLPVLSYRSSTIYLEKIPLDYRNFSPRSFHHLKFFTWQWSLHLGHVALPKYHFFRIFFHLAVNAWNRWITRGLVPTWDPKSSMTFRVRNPRVRTQGPRSSEMLSKIQQQQRVLAPWQMTQEFLPTGRWRRSTPIPCFLAERKCSEKRSPKHSDQKKSEKPWLFELLSWSHQEVGAVWRPKMGNTVEKSDLC